MLNTLGFQEWYHVYYCKVIVLIQSTVMRPYVCLARGTVLQSTIDQEAQDQRKRLEKKTLLLEDRVKGSLQKKQVKGDLVFEKGMDKISFQKCFYFYVGSSIFIPQIVSFLNSLYKSPRIEKLQGDYLTFIMVLL